jgi:crotonobetainyl-CoA:carnitine CoA-transferase CaiB-like acyl-CoA transferase
MPAALQNLQVLDCSETIAGQFCARMLADYGAEVTLLEPPGGSAIRSVGPFDPASRGESLLFFHLNLGKRSLALDVATPDGEALLDRLLARADVAIVGRTANVAAQSAAHPDCVFCVVSGFGSDGPWRDWQGGEIVYQALSGMMNHNGISSREPLFGCGQRASHAAGIAAYIAVLAALHARPQSGGQIVAIDVAETASSMWYPYPLIHAYSGWLEQRGERGQPVGQVKCSDGDWVCFWVRGEQWAAACVAIGRPELTRDPRFATTVERQKHWQTALVIFQEWAAARTADAFLAEWRANRLIGAKAARATELFTNDPHLRARGYWESVQTATGARPILGPQFRMSETPRMVRGPAPAYEPEGAM